MAVKSIKTLELHYTMIQFFSIDIPPMFGRARARIPCVYISFVQGWRGLY